jgi:hypothetical protein
MNVGAHRGQLRGASRSASVLSQGANMAEAIKEVREVLAIRPQGIYSHVILGNYEHRQKSYAAATADYQAVGNKLGISDKK